MIFADSHTHFDFADYEVDREACLDRLRSSGVHLLVIPNVDEASLPKVVGLSQRYPHLCFPSIGLHPTEVRSDYEAVLSRMFESSFSETRYYALGECGLDFYWDQSLSLEQLGAFRLQLDYALDRALPLIIHSRNAFEETVALLQQAPYKGRLRGVFHCFGGSVEQAQRVVDMGFKLGIGGVLTFKNSKLWEVVEAIPLEHLLLETDAPFITPHPHRGTRNESSYLPLIASRMAEIKQEELVEIARQTTKNTIELFQLPTYKDPFETHAS